MTEYCVTARNWDTDFEKRFGERESVHEIEDAEFPALIREFGRIVILEEAEGQPETLLFENDFD